MASSTYRRMLLLDIYEGVLIDMKNVGPHLHGCGPPSKTPIQSTYIYIHCNNSMGSLSEHEINTEKC